MYNVFYKYFLCSFVLCNIIIFCLPFNHEKVKAADDIQGLSVMKQIKGWTNDEITYYYKQLDSEQKQICDYLVGAYNYAYLGSRGFNFKEGQFSDSVSWVDNVKAWGSKILLFTGVEYWQSRVDKKLGNYLSSCIYYAQNQNSTFNYWLNNVPADFVLPYSSDLFDGFNIFYNDTNDGIVSWTVSDSPWVSGTQLELSVTGNWSGNNEYLYDNWVLNNSPFLFSNVMHSDIWSFQWLYKFIFNNTIIDSVFILRSNNKSFRYGNSASLSPAQYFEAVFATVESSYNNIQFRENGSVYSIRSGILTYNSSTSIKDTIDYSFYITPFVSGRNQTTSINPSDGFSGTYPFITHVYLVDNLESLANPVEVNNIDDLGVENGDDTGIIYNPNIELYIDINGITDNPPNNQTNIYNYYITYIYKGTEPDPNDPTVFLPTPVNPAKDLQPSAIVNLISEVDWGRITFKSDWLGNTPDYLSYIWVTARDCLSFVRDTVNCLIFTDNTGLFRSESNGFGIYIWGAFVLSVIGGLIYKFLK